MRYLNAQSNKLTSGSFSLPVEWPEPGNPSAFAKGSETGPFATLCKDTLIAAVTAQTQTPPNLTPSMPTRLSATTSTSGRSTHSSRPTVKAAANSSIEKTLPQPKKKNARGSSSGNSGAKRLKTSKKAGVMVEDMDQEEDSLLDNLGSRVSEGTIRLVCMANLIKVTSGAMKSLGQFTVVADSPTEFKERIVKRLKHHLISRKQFDAEGTEVQMLYTADEKEGLTLELWAQAFYSMTEGRRSD